MSLIKDEILYILIIKSNNANFFVMKEYIK
jgi:hypothetical protein